MGTPMLSGKERSDKILEQVKPQVRNLRGYVSPPQDRVVAKLNQNESPYDIPVRLKEKILKDLKAMPWSRYPEYNPNHLREKLAKRFGLTANQVVLGNGSNALIHVVVTAFLTPGDVVLLSSPSFSFFELVACLFQGSVVKVPRKPDFSYDREALLERASDAKLCIFASPDNPTGMAMDLALLEAILKKTRGVVLWDEAYGEFWGQSAVPLISRYPNLLVLRTFSKAFSLAGGRIGYLFGQESVVGELQKVTVPYNLNLFSVCAALCILEDSWWMESKIKKIIHERQKLFDFLNQIPKVKAYPSETNFILFWVPDGPIVLNQLKKRGVLVRDMGGYTELKNHLRVTVGTPEENAIFCHALQDILLEKVE